MLHASLESLGAWVFVMMIVGTCCKMAWRMDWVMLVGMSVSEMLVVHLVCLMARSKPYVAVLKMGRVLVKEYGQVLSW